MLVTNLLHAKRREVVLGVGSDWRPVKGVEGSGLLFIFVCYLTKMIFMNRFLSAIVLSLIITLPAITQIPTAGLVSHWPFTGNANDAGPGTNHGTVTGATLTTDRFGNSDRAYYFNGSAYITVPHDNSLNMSEGMTISVWVRPDEIHTSGNRMILGKSNYMSSTNYLIRVKPSGYIQWEYGNYTDSKTSPLTEAAWHHVVVTASGPSANKKIYINGLPADVDNAADGPYGLVTSALTFGYAGYGAEYFKGAIDDTRIYSRELSSSEVTALYQEGNCTPYNGIYGMKGSDITFLIDDSFEDGVVGQLPAGWVIRHDGTGTTHQKVTDQVARNGSKSFETSGQSGWAATITKTPPSMPQQVVFESWVRPEYVLAAYSGRIFLGDMDAGTWGTLSATVDFRNGRIEASSSGGAIYDIMPFDAGVWYHVKIIADNEAKVFQVHINGLPASGTFSSTTTTRFPMHATVSPAQAIISAGNGGTVKMWFDDLRLYGIPARLVCQNELPFLFGTQSIAQGGVYSELFSSARGCDSTLTVYLKVSPLPDITVTDNNPEFMANATDATYQWINCATGMALAGETGRSFTATSNGSYAVVVTRGGCADTSACYNVTTLGMREADGSVVMKVYPNPTKGNITITDINSGMGDAVIDVYSASGRHIMTRTVAAGHVTIDITGQPAGIYYVKVTQNGVIRRFRIVKTDQ